MFARSLSRRVHDGREPAGRRVVEEAAQRHFLKTKALPCHRHKAHREQRVAAGPEEVVVGPDGRLQHLGEQGALHGERDVAVRRDRHRRPGS